MNLSLALYNIILPITLYFPVIAPILAIAFLFLPIKHQFRLFLFFLGFQAFFIDIGLTVTLPRLILLLIFASLLLFAPEKIWRGLKNYPAKTIMYTFILFLLAAIVINLPFYPPKTAFTSVGPYDDSILRGQTGRSFTQFLMFLIRAAVPVAIIGMVFSKENVKNLMKWLIAGSTVLCIYAYYQLLAFFLYLPALYIFRGAIRPSGDVGLFKTAWGSKIIRLSSLAGEPKDFAGAILPVIFFLGIYLVLAFRKREKSASRKKIFVGVLFFIHAMAFVLTFSTAAWMAALAAFPVITIFLGKILSFKKTAILITVLAGSLFLLVKINPKAHTIFQSRLTDRLSEKLWEDKNYGLPQLRELYQKRPHTILTGASFGGALLYVNYNEQPESLVYYLLELGVFGTLLFLSFWLLAYKKICERLKFNGDSDAFAIALAGSLLGSLTAAFFFPKLDASLILWVFLGAAVAYSLAGEKTKNYQNIPVS